MATLSAPTRLAWLGAPIVMWLALPLAGWAQQACGPRVTFGTPSCGIGCGTPCQTHHCPPAFKYCYEGAPRIHWTRGCPRPICNPCDLPNWGYYETCWSPYPFPPNWSHCPTLPPAAFVNLSPYVNPNLPQLPVNPQRVVPPGTLPMPSTLPPGHQGPVDELPQPRRIEGSRPGI
jgi:hypothetical protein